MSTFSSRARVGGLSHYLVEGWKEKSIPVLQNRLIEIMEITMGRKVTVRPPTNIPHRKHTAVLGSLTTFQQDCDEDKKEEIEDHDQSCKVQWRDNDQTGKGSVLSDMQHWGRKIKLDKCFVGKRIECLTEYTIAKSDGTPSTDLRWCGALVESVSDGTWAKTGVRGKILKISYKGEEAANVFWEAVEETDEPAQCQIIELKPTSWNGSKSGAW